MISLVLSGGGARGAYQAGVLRRVAEMRPDLPFSILVGSSAGAVNISFLACRANEFSKAVEDLNKLWGELTIDKIYRAGTFSLSWTGMRWLRDLAGGGLVAGSRVQSLLNVHPLEDLVKTNMNFQNIPTFISENKLRAVSLIATSYTTGQTVNFLHADPNVIPWTGTRRVAVATALNLEHVLASCAIPFFFPAVRVSDGYFGDGNIRLSNPFSPAVKLGARRIFAVSLRRQTLAREMTAVVHGYPPPAQVAGILLNSIFLDSFDDDAQQLERVNSLVRAGAPTNNATPLRQIKLLMMTPSRDLGRLATEYQNRFPAGLRWLLRGIGADEIRSADLVSYLLFDQTYTQTLLELGYEDAKRRSAEIEEFFAADPL